MITLVAGLVGVLIGFLASPNPTVAVVCGAAFALVAWALMGFKMSGTTPQNQSEPPDLQPRATPSTTEPVAESAETAPTTLEANRKWRNFKVKALLVVTAVVVAANYERCTESSQERVQRERTASQQLQDIAREDAYEECRKGGGERECREAADRAADLAREKAKVLYGR